MIDSVRFQILLPYRWSSGSRSARFLESKTTGNERRHSRSWAKANKQCEKVWVRGTRSPARPCIRLRSARGREQQQEWDAVIGSRAVRERTEFLKSRSVYWSICLSHSAELRESKHTEEWAELCQSASNPAAEETRRHTAEQWRHDIN